MIQAMDAVRAIARHRGDAVVVSTMTAMKEWASVSARRELDLDLRGAMGKAADLGLGLALARPDVRVLVLDGDGSLLMNLGCLVTVANLAPANFVHILFDDGAYTTTGGQPVPGAGRVDYAAMARAAGYREAWNIETLEELESRLPRCLIGARGPVLISLRVSHLAPLPPGPKRSTAAAMRDVQKALAGRKTGPGP